MHEAIKPTYAIYQTETQAWRDAAPARIPSSRQPEYANCEIRQMSSELVEHVSELKTVAGTRSSWNKALCIALDSNDSLLPGSRSTAG